GAVVVSRALAETFWPDAHPGRGGRGVLGRQINNSGQERDTPWYTVVGVVDAVRSESLTEAPVKAIYYPMVALGDGHALYYVLRASVPPESLVPAVRAAVRHLDLALPISRVQTLEAVVSAASASTRFTMTLLALAGGMALLLGSIGVYGVVAYAASSRRGEIGVRMALGADHRRVSRLVLGQGLVPALVGIGLGAGAALALGSVLEAVLFDVAPEDPVTLVATATLLLVVTAAASWIPTRRATRLDPSEALRRE
ncbi:MAG TPA: FtsX-like permease family protein, partial [Longimicrobiales bacterium]|nr:FtsX-like permease family protein [Longimicrobiales bacterium]